MASAERAQGATARPVVTVFESYGSGADDIGPRVAEALGVPFHAQAFASKDIEDAMDKHVSEGVLSRVFGAMGGRYRTYTGLDGTAVAMAQRDNYDLVMDNTRHVVEAARGGGVIMGRNGALILADWPAALHVRLDGPLRARLERAAQRTGISVEEAAKRQTRIDQVRADMSIELYGWDPREFDHYDLGVNTGLMDADTCVEIIVAAARVKVAHAQPAPATRP